VGLVESNGTAGFMSNVTCELTAKKPASAPRPKLVIGYGTTFTLLFIWKILTSGEKFDDALSCFSTEHEFLRQRNRQTTKGQNFSEYTVLP